jgi:hypothetical protein
VPSWKTGLEGRLQYAPTAISIAASACHTSAYALLPNVARAMLIVPIYPALLDESNSEFVLALPGRARYTTPVPEGLTP